MLLMIKDAVNYRHFIYSSIKAEINGRYARSRLGGAWLILNPLAQSLVLAVVLSQLLGARLSGIESEYAYAVYLLSGTLAWNFFAETTSNTISMFRDRAHLLKKVNFPRVCIPIIVVGTSMINHFFLMIVVFVIVWGLGISPSISLMILPLFILINLAFALSIGTILSVFDVFNRDIGHLWQIITNFLFWLTPVVYVPNILPSVAQEMLIYNPMYWITHGYQQVIAYGNIPSLQPFIILGGITLLLLSLGFFIFLRASSDIVDAL